MDSSFGWRRFVVSPLRRLLATVAAGFSWAHRLLLTGPAFARHGGNLMGVSRRLPIGAEVLPSGGAHFRVWSPRAPVEVVLERDNTLQAVALEPEPGGYYAGQVATAGHGTLYRFRFPGDAKLYPDPASRFQPDGPHGPSQIVDPARFQWTDGGWRGVALKGQVIYELHIGTF